MKRRIFLRQGVTLLVVVAGVPMVVSCADRADGASADGATGDLIVTSSVVGGHSHDFTLPGEVIATPPSAGYSNSSTTSSAHAHTVSLTQQQIQTIAGGTAVTVTSSSTSGHAHQFRFALA